MAGSKILGQLINAIANRKYLDYGYLKQIMDIFPSVLISLFMGVCVYFVSYLNTSNIITLLIQIPMGVVIYMLFSWLFQRELLSYSFSLILELMHKNAKRASGGNDRKHL